jgi:hypothetical protein
MVLLTLADFVLQKTGGDSMAEIAATMNRWRERLAAGATTGVAGSAGSMAAGEVTLGSGGDD